MTLSPDSIGLQFVKKISTLIVKIFHPSVPAKYRYYVRDTYVCKIWQLKYFFRDYILKKEYKVLDFEGEFAPEIQFALPHAYWHYKNGTLKQTNSFRGTREFYFFSKNHNETFTARTDENNYNYDLPRIVYSHNYYMKKWLPVPLKENYKNDVYVFDKPMLVIANKYNTEWDGPPVNYFSIDMLDILISHLKDKYTIVYNRPQAKDIVNDNSIIFDLNEFEWLRQKHPYVLLMSDLYNENKVGANNFNHFQLSLYSNCDNFISIHGGTAALASYFGGKNIIFSKSGPEHYFKCYEKLYPKFSSAVIYHARTEEELLNLASRYY